jgi:hypothetical protein
LLKNQKKKYLFYFFALKILKMNFFFFFKAFSGYKISISQHNP